MVGSVAVLLGAVLAGEVLLGADAVPSVVSQPAPEPSQLRQYVAPQLELLVPMIATMLHCCTRTETGPVPAQAPDYTPNDWRCLDCRPVILNSCVH